MEFIYAIGVLLNVLRNVVKVSPAVEELFEQVCEQVYRVKCTIVDLEAEVARLKAENEGLQHTGPAECKGEIVFWPGDSTKKICAIKALRGIFGMGLKEAKELVESGRCPKPVTWVWKTRWLPCWRSTGTWSKRSGTRVLIPGMIKNCPPLCGAIKVHTEFCQIRKKLAPSLLCVYLYGFIRCEALARRMKNEGW